MDGATKTDKSEDDLRFDEATLQFIEEIGLIFEKNGVARVAGRIIGLLLIAYRPLNQEQIAEILQVSRASVSTNLKLGETYRLIKVVPRRKPGDRRDYYEITPDGWERAFERAEQEAQTILKLARAGLEIIAADNLSAQKRLREMEALYECYIEAWENFEQTWQKRKAELNFED